MIKFIFIHTSLHLLVQQQQAIWSSQPQDLKEWYDKKQHVNDLKLNFQILIKDKILQSADPSSKNMQVTNDGATILKAIGVDNPAAKVLVGMK